MKIVAAFTLTATLLISGCASVDMTTKAESEKAKEFNLPSQGNAGVYIYRNSFVGQALKKDIWIDGKCYFIRQFIKMGAFVGGAGLEQISEEQGKIDVAKLDMAKSGKCSAVK